MELLPSAGQTIVLVPETNHLAIWSVPAWIAQQIALTESLEF